MNTNNTKIDWVSNEDELNEFLENIIVDQAIDESYCESMENINIQFSQNDENMCSCIDDEENLYNEIIDSIDKQYNQPYECEIHDENAFNSIQQYFREINNIYNKWGNDYNIVYCPENRDKLIEMNLKTVISIAKKYQGLGLTLEELISAGNLGLVIAYDKFDPTRSKLKDDILNSISQLPNKVTYEELIECIKSFMTYGDIKSKFDKLFESLPSKIINKKDVITWIKNNIQNAKFSSIASMWIRAYILIEIDNNSRIVKKPKTEIYKDKEKDGAYKREILVDIDSPISDDSNTCVGDLLPMTDTSRTELEISESYDIFKSELNKLLDGVKVRDRSIFLKKFGIGLPRPMLPKEIADQEGLSIARISQIFQTVIEQMQLNQAKYNIDPDVLFDVVKKFR